MTKILPKYQSVNLRLCDHVNVFGLGILHIITSVLALFTKILGFSQMHSQEKVNVGVTLKRCYQCRISVSVTFK